MSRKIIELCEPILTWLKEAEEESSEDEDDVAVDFDDRARVTGTIVEKKPTPAVNGKAVHADNSAEEDLDIENI